MTQSPNPEVTLPEETQTPPAPLVPPPPTRRQPSVIKELAMLFIKIGVIVAIVVGVFTFVYGIHQVVDPHMSPMVMDGDLAIFFRLNRDYDIGELVLLRFEGHTQIRRIVAQAGDIVNITEQGLIVNNALIHEPMIFQQTWRLETAVNFPLTVGEGQIFVLGDARETAIDSRAYGPVNISDTLGSVITLVRRRGM